MSEWRKYGRWLLVSSGIAVTGALWYRREAQVARAEDFAACSAAYIERSVAYAVGTNAAHADFRAWPTAADYAERLTNNPFGEDDFIAAEAGYAGRRRPRVGTVPTWERMYGEVLDDARTCALSATPVGTGVHVWLDPLVELPANGSLIAGAWQTWVESGEPSSGPPSAHTWALTGNIANAFSALAALGTRHRVAGVRFRPGISNWYPVAELMADRALPSPATNATPWSEGNWWTAVLGYTNVYAYWCEGDDPGAEVSATVIGSGFSLATNRWVFGADPVSGRGMVNIYSLSPVSDSNVVRAAMVRLSLIGGGPASVAVSDWHAGAAPALVVSSYAVSLPGGQHEDLSVRPSVAPPTISVIQISVATSDADVTASATAWPYTEMVFGPNNWQTPQTLRIAAGDSAANGSAVVSLSGIGSPVQIAVGVSGGNGAETALAADSALITVPRQGSNGFEFVVLRAPTNSVIETDRRLKTNDLNDARMVLASMRRSAYVITADDWAAFAPTSGWKAVTISGYSNSVGLATDYDQDDARAALSAVLAGASEQRSETSAGWYGNISLSASCSAAIDYDGDGDVFYSQGQFIAQADCEWVEARGCEIADWPCAFAFASNMVSRYRVYACVGVSPATVIPMPVPTAQGAEILDRTVDYSMPGFNSEHDFGILGLSASGCAKYPDFVPRNNSEHVDYPDSGATSMAYAWTLLADVENPTSRPQFDLGRRPGGVTPGQMQQSGITYQYENARKWRTSVYESTYRVFRVTHLVVVVDWRWNHFGDSEFEEDLWIPEFWR